MTLRPLRTVSPETLPDPQILYTDDHIVVVDKPSMMLSVPGRGVDKADCVVARLTRDQTPLVIHRLDMETSGLLVLAWTAEAQSHLSQQFMDRTVSKTYEAIVYGHMTEDSFEVDLPLITDWPNRPKQMVDHEIGKWAKTIGRVLDRGDNRTHVSLTPVTGRSHQLRVHMQALGHPILGDTLYAHESAYTCVDRMLLHAKQLAFIHPKSGEKMNFCSTTPFTL